DLKRDAQALAEARDQAQKANRSKSEFLANMSHEIRTPLNGVVGLVDVLSRTDLNGHQREIVDIIRSSGVTLERLLNEVLDLARIESGCMEVRNETFDLARTVRDVAGLAELRARDKGVGFRLEMDAAASALVHGDPDRLKQILLNLLSNAVKFTSIGEVCLEVVAMTIDEVRCFRFEVSDTGVGFSMEDKERLFQRFEQADGSITRRFGGSGLGLAIAFELAGLLGGWIDAESIEGEGATFTVQLPLPEASGRAAEQTPDDGPSKGAVDADLPALRARVLLAEDHPINRKVVELILQTAGADLTSVENGALALEAFRAGAFDLVLMDVQMPVMDGLTAIRAIRAHEQAAALASTPIVALTANALPEHVKASADAGADAHLTKPITAASLLPLVEQLVRSSRALGELRAASVA
ncbi:MAG TPA: ATP-binding protein, partial [Caulobacteraceae bacterium]